MAVWHIGVESSNGNHPVQFRSSQCECLPPKNGWKWNVIPTYELGRSVTPPVATLLCALAAYGNIIYIDLPSVGAAAAGSYYYSITSLLANCPPSSPVPQHTIALW